MSTKPLKYKPEEFFARGTKIYQEQVLPLLGQDCLGKIVAIDIETGEYAIADTTLEAADKMAERLPEPQLWFERVGSETVYNFSSVRPAYL
jgi:hypothetical protein